MTTKHRCTDSRGEVWTRTSERRVYTHCVVVRFKTMAPSERWPMGWDARSRAEWAGSAVLAAKNAATWQKRESVESVEVIPAEIVGKVAA